MFRFLGELIADVLETLEYPPADAVFLYGEGDGEVLRLRPGIDPRPKAIEGLEDDEIDVIIADDSENDFELPIFRGHRT